MKLRKERLITKVYFLFIILLPQPYSYAFPFNISSHRLTSQAITATLTNEETDRISNKLACDLCKKENNSLRPQDFISSNQTASNFANGKINATPAFKAAIENGIKHIVLPCGTYRFDEPLNITFSFVRISGGQYGCTTIQQNFLNGDAFHISGAGVTGGIEGVTIDHIKVIMSPGLMKKSGASFHIDSAHNIKFDNDRSDGDYIGFDLRSGSNQFDYFVSNNEVNHASYAAFVLSDNGDPTIQVEDIYLLNNAVGHSNIGYLIQNASGTFGLQSDICCGGNQGVVVAPNIKQNVNALYLTKFLADQMTGTAAFSFPDTKGFVSEVRLSDCWGASGTTGTGLEIANPRLDGLVMTGFQAHANAQSGVDIEAGKNITILGAQVFFNSKSPNGGFPGVLIQGSASHITIADSMLGDGGLISVNGSKEKNRQSYGLLISGNAEYVIAHDNQLFNNSIGGILDKSFNSKKNSIHDNLSGLD